ncbi:MAG: ABC transporter ATP-binding protein [Clostridia bacterium]|nr:ABC transporter ATP-binding protein [Clostridia bacterium]
MMTKMLDAQALTRRYGDFVALDHVSLKLEPGQGLALLGRNGSGKSTLLALLALADSPDEGRVEVDGLPPGQARQALAYAPQEISLLEELTVEENLLCWSSLPRKEGRGRALELCRDLSLAGLRRKRVDRLSGGQRRRVNLAAALMSHARYLLLDEPFSGVDEEGAIQIRDMLLTARAQGRGMVISGHQPQLLRPLVSHVLVLEQGKAIFFGRAEQYFAAFPEQCHEP